ncbi:MAG: protein phosphatase CheZ [Pseudodesulfovibrio sp.]|uniref:Chemotaxis phosphatase CheZ n=2 Tax=Pseudodesulfovibrio aespoeensis TaxID=182210 RepID=E6VYG4_PSEA9|nr:MULTISPECIES: protein phosphatase CheZ [Pseudodesulfovibrio]MBU4515664.1 protein phosphatase CheZ [Pseudomonadota bacterium]ADU62727.1 Chemotaxis phosphatase CheZ [Pseudodesulfovibrio aespoeensis Aspo-2]MBU4523393.1 protein phosphatase CheZ [Pseudomonadota bacterium]MBU4560501.1 protein phosphatase CheZ [Pseudomonadota bacterium]MBV1766589.1 protein phosphatase CheZ [Pseudodesulfovibrio sp.]
MTGNEELVKALMEKVSDQLVASLRDTISVAVEKEIAKNLSKSLLEGEFYRRVNEDLQDGLKKIYHEVKAAKGGNEIKSIETAFNPEELFSETSDQLDAVLRTTEKAAVDIIDIVEKLQDMQTTVDKIVKGFESGGVTKQDRVRLKEINQTLGNDLSTIMVTLSFQDLTGQRIKIIINSIREVEKIVRQVMLSTGLMIRQREKEPDKDINSLSLDAKTQASSKLQGPSEGSKQGDVDDLLASLGLD